MTYGSKHQADYCSQSAFVCLVLSAEGKGHKLFLFPSKML